MKGLFLKTFIWFWLTTIITISVTYLISSRLINTSQHSDQLDELIEHYVEEAQEKISDDGLEEFRQWLEHRRLPRGIGVLLLDDKTSVIAQRRIPRPILEHFLTNKKWPESSDIKLNVKQQSFHTEVGQVRLFVIWFPKKNTFKNSDHSPWFKQLNKRTPGWAAFRLLIALLISGLICYLLARYISKPIIKLRSAVKELSLGNFDTHVAKEFNKRNDEIAELATDFDLMASELKNQFKQREDLLRDISHELRSPLARMRVASELIKSRTQMSNLKEINRIELEIIRLDELISEIIDFSKLKNQTTNVDKDHFNLTELLGEIIEDANFECKIDNRQVETDSIKLSNINIKANKKLLSRALENVIRNAMKYTAENTKVIVSLIKENGQAIIKVSDQGPGVPAQNLNQIFEPFFRISQSRSRESGGTGLGLAISKRAIELHNGKIDAKNRKQRGLVITIQLPLAA